ncbi:hemerythrin family protein [Sulfurovum sp. zt1-1]|uniref:Hemerythrin family protein n=1 Tax=Sulfurovum zhangzhouensis TaxID=3019067 RepID=A0ABT7QXE0_9BACT|nr:hemerythrin family protein [Sulfurovum zhangzhouensis]MDM5271503.1 hemerythrin family protein [Sulfurovum zhangzhouensis]
MIDKERLPQVAYQVMNEVHEEEVDLLNRLENELSDEVLDISKVDELLNTLLEHTKEHFANEERLMQEVFFPAMMMHQGEHIRVINEMKMVVNRWELTRDPELIREYFLGTLIEWLMLHINTMDTITAQFITMHKGGH